MTFDRSYNIFFKYYLNKRKISVFNQIVYSDDFIWITFESHCFIFMLNKLKILNNKPQIFLLLFQQNFCSLKILNFSITIKVIIFFIKLRHILINYISTLHLSNKTIHISIKSIRKGSIIRRKNSYSQFF